MSAAQPGRVPAPGAVWSAPSRSHHSAAWTGTHAPVQPVLVIASSNPHKVAEISAMLEALHLDVRRLPEGLDIEETGSTYGANARLKAETAAVLTGQWALADDSGIEVDALGGRPGIYSARYADSDPARIQRLLRELGDAPYRSASFRSAMALANPQGTTVLESEGLCRGTILTAPMGSGVGYDPIFHVRRARTSYALMPPHQKAMLGSRGRAARGIAAGLKHHLRIS